jgi:peptidoglycan-associated lipoprotein
MITHRLFAALLAIGVAGGCSHPQSNQTATSPARAVAAASRAAPTRISSATRTSASPSASTSASGSSGRADKELAVFFDFDSALLRDDAGPVLQKVASVAQAREASVRIEGNCDELGTVEYNLTLGEHRAIQAKDYLARLGVPAARIKTVSYGSQRPRTPGHDEQAHAQNRRDDFVVN